MSRDLVTVDFEPVGRRINASLDETVLAAAQRGGVGLVAVCGGGGTCGRCIVQVRAGELTPPTEVELKKLGAERMAQGFRLACQCKPLGNVRLHVPPSSLTATQRAQIEGRERQVEFDPAGARRARASCRAPPGRPALRHPARAATLAPPLSAGRSTARSTTACSAGWPPTLRQPELGRESGLAQCGRQPGARSRSCRPTRRPSAWPSTSAPPSSPATWSTWRAARRWRPRAS